MTATELAVVGGAAGAGAVVGALVSGVHLSLMSQRWPTPGRRRRPVPALLAPSVVVIDRQHVRLLQAGGAPADGGRALHLVGPRPYDWARDGEAVA